MRYTQLGSSRYLSNHQQSFLDARNCFEENRATWLGEGKPRFVQIKDAQPVVFVDDYDELPRTNREGRWNFEIRTVDEERAFWRSDNTPTFELLAEPLLDTDMPEYLFQADRVLDVRGYSERRQRTLRRMVDSGLFWNTLHWWNWSTLSLGDFFYGWAINLVLLALPLGVFAMLAFGTSAGLIGLIGTMGLAFLSWRTSRALRRRS